MFKFNFLIRTAISAVFLCFSCQWIAAQQLTFSILDEFHRNLPGASVNVNEFASITDGSGKAIFSDLKSPYTIRISYVGYISIDTTISDAGNYFIFDMKPDILMLQEGFVTASWVTESSAVTQKTISKNSIYTNNVTDMPLLLESLPGSVATSDAGNGVGYSALRIRGSDQTRINVMIDGVPVNDAESQNVFWVDLPDMVEDVQSIQVQRGVGVSTAGPGAFGANINLKTGLLSDKPSLSANVGYGSFNSNKYGLSVNSGSLGDFHFKVRGSHVSSDGYIDRATADLWAASFQSQYSKNKFSLAANAYWGKQTTYQAWNGLPVNYYLENNATTYNPSGLKGDGTFFDDETDNYMQLYSRVIGNYRFSNEFSLQLTFYNTLGKGYYNQYREENINDYFSNVESQEVALVRERWLDNSLSGLNYLFNLTKKDWNYQLGGNVQYYDGKHFGIIKTIEQIPSWAPRRYYENEAVKKEASIFLKAEKNIDRFNFFGDAQIRFIDYSFEGNTAQDEIGQVEKDFFFFNPKAGITYFTNDERSGNIYLFGGVANKEPNRDDFTDAAPGKIPKHETMYNSELGYRWSVNRWNISVNQYFMYYRNQLVLTGQINDVGAYTRFNVDKSYRFGIEADVNLKVNKYLSINGNVAISRNKVIDFKEFVDASELVGEEVNYLDQEVIDHGDSDISFSPSMVGFGQLSYKPFAALNNLWAGLNLAYNYKYVSSQYLDNSSNEFSRLDAYATHGISVNLPVKLKKNEFIFNFQMDNLLDKTFVNNGWSYRFKAVGYDAAAGDPYIQQEGNNYYSSVGYFPQAGRRFFLGLKYSLK